MKYTWKTAILLMIPVMLSGCGNSTVPETTAVTETTAAPETETETIAETEPAQPVQDGIFTLNPSSDVFVKDVGNYETYLTDFHFPDNYRLFMSCGQVPLDITIGTDGKTNTVTLQFPEADDLDYTVYLTDTDIYSNMFSSDTTTKSKHAVLENENSINNIKDSIHNLNITKATFTYVDYNGEETIDGIVYDSLACEMKNNNTKSDCTFYFTKDGEYAKTTMFCPETNDTGYIEPILTITMPELTPEETDAGTIAADYLSLLRAGLNAKQETTEPPTEETTASANNDNSDDNTEETKLAEGLRPENMQFEEGPTPEDTPEGEVFTDVQFFGGYNNNVNTMNNLFYARHYDIAEGICTTYYFDNKEDGQQYNRWCLDAQMHNKSLKMTFEYYVKDGLYHISNILDHTLIAAE